MADECPLCGETNRILITPRELTCMACGQTSDIDTTDELAELQAEIERLRGYARHLLLAEMHDISEGSSCAGWPGDWAADLWACLLDPALDCGLFGGELSHWTDVDRLVGLIRDAQCWWDYDSNNTLQPIPLVKWEAAHGVLPADIIERHEAADAAKKRRENNNG